MSQSRKESVPSWRRRYELSRYELSPATNCRRYELGQLRIVHAMNRAAMNCRCYELSAMNCPAMNCLAMNGRVTYSVYTHI